MLRKILILLLTAVCCSLSHVLYAQRILGAYRFLLDDRLGNSLLIGTPLSGGWNGRLLVLPVPPASPTEMGFINRGPNGAGPQGQSTFWFDGQWRPTNALRFYDANGDNLPDLNVEGDIIPQTLGIDLGTPQRPFNTIYVNSFGSTVTLSFSQITSGINLGNTLSVGNGSTLAPTGTGTISANRIVGSSTNPNAGALSGSIAITQGSLNVAIAVPAIVAASGVVVSIEDPAGASVGVQYFVIKNPGVGFTVEFSAPYPTGAGRLNYLITQP